MIVPDFSPTLDWLNTPLIFRQLSVVSRTKMASAMVAFRRAEALEQSRELLATAVEEYISARWSMIDHR